MGLQLYCGHSIFWQACIYFVLLHLFQVDDLKAELAVQEIELKAKNEAADALIEMVGVETDKVSKEKALGRFHFGLVGRTDSLSL